MQLYLFFLLGFAATAMAKNCGLPTDCTYQLINGNGNDGMTGNSATTPAANVDTNAKSQYQPGEQMRLTCTSGGAALTSTCQSDGTWSPSCTSATTTTVKVAAAAATTTTTKAAVTTKAPTAATTKAPTAATTKAPTAATTKAAAAPIKPVIQIIQVVAARPGVAAPAPAAAAKPVVAAAPAGGHDSGERKPAAAQPAAPATAAKPNIVVQLVAAKPAAPVVPVIVIPSSIILPLLNKAAPALAPAVPANITSRAIATNVQPAQQVLTVVKVVNITNISQPVLIAQPNGILNYSVISYVNKTGSNVVLQPTNIISVLPVLQSAVFNYTVNKTLVPATGQVVQVQPTVSNYTVNKTLVPATVQVVQAQVQVQPLNCSREVAARRYFPIPGAFLWAVAVNKCWTMGARLAQIKNKEQQDAITNIAGKASQASGCNGFWVGLRATNATAPFLWNDGSALTFSNWARNEPDRRGCTGSGTLCTRVAYGGVWDDVFCSPAQLEGAICEYPAC